MATRRCVWAKVLLVLTGLLGLGCSNTYWQNRGRDAMAMVDVGIVTTTQPHFALFNDYFNLIPLGYSNLDGTFHGIGNGRHGAMPIRIRYWGVIAWGSRDFQLGEFDLNDPVQVSPEWIAALRAANQPLPTATPRYNTGFLRMALQDNVPPRRTGTMCRRNLHLGWFGFTMSTHYDAVGAFFLGWFGIGGGPG